MRNPNGYGTVAKLSGQRRRPYIVKKTIGWNDKGHPIYDIIGYAETREAGNIMLAEYNRDPWDVDRAKITLQQLFDLWKEKKAPKLGESNRSSLCSAFKHCSAYVNKPYKQLRSYQMQETIDGCGKGYSTQAAIKNLWGHLDRFALEMDIINRCFSELLTSDPIPETSRLPFTNDEIKTVWEHQSDPWVDTVLILLYSGWRISEFLNLKPEDIDLKEGTMKGGTKTKAGKNRIVPIHPKIKPLIERRLAEGGNLQPGIDHFLSVEGLKQNLDVVVKGKSNIGQVRTQEDQHGPPNIDQVVQNSVQHGSNLLCIVINFRAV